MTNASPGMALPDTEYKGNAIQYRVRTRIEEAGKQ